MGNLKEKIGNFDVFALHDPGNEKALIAYMVIAALTFSGNSKNISRFCEVHGVDRRMLYRILNQKNYTIDQLLAVTRPLNIVIDVTQHNVV